MDTPQLDSLARPLLINFYTHALTLVAGGLTAVGLSPAGNTPELLAGVTLAAIHILVGYFNTRRAALSLPPGAKPASRIVQSPLKALAAAGLFGAALFGLTGCATQSSTATAVESYAAEAAGVAATGAVVELVGGQNGGPSKAAIATDFLTVANAGYTIVASGNLTTAQIDAIFESFKSDANTTSYDSIAEDVAQQLELYLQANPNANAQEVLTSFFQGVQLAASALGGTTPAAVTSSDGHRPPLHWLPPQDGQGLRIVSVNF